VNSRLLFALLFAALAIAARLPFLVTGKIPFDSDEAVEGLMARHVLNGEFPAFFWGQAFKGVPEVYVAAGAFALFGTSVVLLKGVTLAFFAAYIALNFALLDKLASRWLAVTATSLLIFAPPALVFWSLDASAEYIVIMLLGSLLLLLCLRLEDTAKGESQASKGLLAAMGLVAGLGLWVHQLFVVYLFPIAVILTLQSDWWRQREFGRPNIFVVVIAGIAGVYVALGVIAFLTGGFSLRFGPVALSATAPQKMLRIAVAIGALAIAFHALRTLTLEQVGALIRHYWPMAIGFLAGYLPVAIYSIAVEPARSPARNANLRQLWNAAPDLLGNVIPILSGFKIATTERLSIPSIAALPVIAALVAYLWSCRARLARLVTLRAIDASIASDFFALFVVFVPVLFLVSGAYVDTQSYRYLIPWYAGLSVAWSAGSLTLARGRKSMALAIVGTILAVHVWQQTIWYMKLQPDARSLALVDCMKQNGIRGGYAEYWTAYKLTFLAKEEVIIAPTDGVDRYPSYTHFVQSLPANAKVNVGSGVCP
jgi:hypothetical protein